VIKSSALIGAAASLLVAGSAQAALVAYFPLDGTAGDFVNDIDDVIDDGSHPVTDGTTNVTDSATWVNDATRGSVLFSPTGQRFLAGTQGINASGTNGFTWSFWAKSGNDTSGVVIGTRNGSWHKIQFDQVDGSGLADFNYRSDAALNQTNGDLNFGDGQWHHFGYVGTGGEVRMYVDGVLVGGDTSLSNGGVAETLQMEIGGSTRFSEYVDVFLDDIAVWDEALSEQQIVDLANGAAVPEPGSLALLGLGTLLIARRRRG
jgi:hypothetical protein